MKCPYCNSTRSKVLETRRCSRAVYRVRECLDCDRRQVSSEQHFGFQIPQEALAPKKRRAK